MNLFLKENRLYFIPLLAVVALGCLFLYYNRGGEELLFFSNNRYPITNFFFRGVNFLGEGYFYALATIIFLQMRNYSKALCIFAMGFIVMVLSQLMKNFFGQPRPSIYFSEILKLPDALQPVPGVALVSSYTSSFPSGHSTAAFALYGLLAFFIAKPTMAKPLLLLLAIMAASARIYLGQHFLSDVMAGAVLGTLLATLVYSFHGHFASIDKKV